MKNVIETHVKEKYRRCCNVDRHLLPFCAETSLVLIVNYYDQRNSNVFRADCAQVVIYRMWHIPHESRAYISTRNVGPPYLASVRILTELFASSSEMSNILH